MTEDVWVDMWRLLDEFRRPYDKGVWRRVLRDVPVVDAVRIVADWSGERPPRPWDVKRLAVDEPEPDAEVPVAGRCWFGLRDVQYVINLGKQLGGDDGREYVDGFWRSVAAGVTVVRPEVRAKYAARIAAAGGRAA